jgi:hypothetical protein
MRLQWEHVSIHMLISHMYALQITSFYSDSIHIGNGDNLPN